MICRSEKNRGIARLVLQDNTVSVYCTVMGTYKDALDAYLKRDGNSEPALAEAVGCKQATINRYRNGKRFPDATTARELDAKTDGQVPFALWQSEFFERSGIAA